MKKQTFQIDADIAVKYGVEKAIIINEFVKLTRNAQIYEGAEPDENGLIWFELPYPVAETLVPFFYKYHTLDLINELVKDGVVLKKVPDESRDDAWYAITGILF